MVTVKLSVPWNGGVAQLGFWCVEDLVKAGRSETVYIVPIGIQYRYVPSWRKLDLQSIEADSGLPVQRIDQSATLTRKRFTINDSFAWVSISLTKWSSFIPLLSPNPTRTKLASNG